MDLSLGDVLGNLHQGMDLNDNVCFHGIVFWKHILKEAFLEVRKERGWNFSLQL